MKALRSRDLESAAKHFGVWVLTLSVALGPVAPAAFANPENGTIAVGGVEIGPGEIATAGDDVPLGGTLTDTVITTVTDHTVLDWESFDVTADESVTFVQPSEVSAVLNRVLGVRASLIDGRISSNGRVYIANEGGITFGGSAVVDVGQLVAAAGDISNEDFLAGVDHFQGLQGGVVNQGEINAGSVTLAGQWVSNQGTIVVDDGALFMLAGDEIWITEVGSPILIQLQMSGVAPAGPQVENTGTLDAGRGRVRLAAGDPLGISIRNTGDIIARNISIEGNDLVQVSGLLDASSDVEGELGGTIEVLGDRVALLGAELDASGDGGGGTILVGGDAHGAAGVRSATYTHVSADSQLRADATREGDGGKVVVWANDTAQIFGEISATGGVEGGDGGFAETSGKRMLQVTHAPDLSAPNGAGGDWLIDPSDVDIVKDGGLANEPPQSLDPAFDSPFFDGRLLATEDTAIVSTSVIVGALEAGVNVTITTETFLNSGNARGNIRVRDPILLENSDVLQLGALTLLAANNITLEAPGIDPVTLVMHDGGSIESTVEGRSFPLFIEANDQFQPEKLDDTPDNAFIGSVVIDAPITIADGNVLATSINGRSVTVNTEINTGGGALFSQSTGGDFELGTNAAVETGGGEFNVLAISADTELDPELTEGGGIRFLDGATVDTGGGDLVLNSDGGDILLFEGAPPSTTSPLVTGGGLLFVEARVDRNAFGGRVVVDNGIDTSDLDGEVGGAQFYDADRSVTLNGRLTSGGGDVVVGPDGTVGRVVIAGTIDTDGGGFVSLGDEFQLSENAVIDASDAPGDSEHGNIRFDHRGQGTVEAGVQLTGAEVRLHAGQDGEGNLTFSDGRAGPGRPAGGAPQIITADAVILAAGDGYTPTGAPSEEPLLGPQREAEIELGGLQLAGLTAANPMSLEILQDADLTAANFDNLLPSGTVDEFTLQAADGTLTVDDVSRFVGSELTLIAKGQPNTPTGPNDGDIVINELLTGVDRINIQTAEGFIVTTALADDLALANQIDIQSGTGSRAESVVVNLDTGETETLPAVDGDLRLESGVMLSATGADSSINLHAGSNGVGDLVFDSGVTLTAQTISLRAGAGNSSLGLPAEDQARIFATSTQPTYVAPLFLPTDNTMPREFTFRQDASIVDSDIPDRSQLGGDLSNTTYTLQSDVSDVTIGVEGGAAPSKVDDSDLRVLAAGNISFLQNINVPSADIGRMGDFQVSQTLLDAVQSGMTTELVLRAGTNGAGVLSFVSDVTVAADNIRLVAGDGFGGQVASSIQIDDFNNADHMKPAFVATDGISAPQTFVFEQDTGIDDVTFEVLPEAADFGDRTGTGPDVYGVRSDDGSIQLSDPADLIGTNGRLVVSAETIDISRVDDDLLFDEDGRQVELRGDFITLMATATPSETEPVLNMGDRVDASGLQRITGFEGADADAGELDTSVGPDTAPTSFTIVQDGSIGDDGSGDFGLPDGSTFGTASPEQPVSYRVVSNSGSIAIDDPASVADTSLFLGVVLEEATITLPNQPLSLNSLSANSRFDLRINAGVDITAVEDIVLAAGQSGEGHLSFDSGVQLSANAITLSSGNGALPAEDERAPVPRVDAKTGAPQFTFTGTDPEFFFNSDAEVAVFEDPTMMATTESQLPLGSQLSGSIARYSVRSNEGSVNNPDDGPIASIDIANFDFADFGTPDVLDLDGGAVAVRSSGLLDFRGDPDTEPQLNLRGFVIELEGSEVMPAGERLQMTGPQGSFEESPRLFTISQDVAVTAENLPNIDQFGGGLRTVIDDGAGGAAIANVIYAVESKTGGITIDSDFADKVLDAQLIVQTDSMQSTDILTDLALFSLTANSAVNFEATPDQSADPLDMDPDFTPEVTTVTDQIYIRDITLNAPETRLTGASVQTLGEIDGAADLIVTARDAVVIAASVGSTTPLQSLEVNITGPDGFIEFGGLVDAGTETDPAVIQAMLESPLNVRTTNGIRLNPTGRSGIPLTASIFKRFGDLTLTTEGDLEVGTNEKIAVGGTLGLHSCDLATCTTPMGRVTVGDLSALEIEVTATVLEVMRRAAGSVLTNGGGVTEDAGVDLVSNRFDLNFNEFVLSGSGRNPLLGVPSQAAIPPLPVRLSVAEARSGGRPIVVGDFGDSGDPESVPTELLPGSNFQVDLNLQRRAGGVDVLDLRPAGSSGADLTESLTEAVPAPGVASPFPFRPEIEPLAALGVAVREPTADELRGWAEGAAIYDDVSGGANRMGGIVLVAAPRLVAGEAHKSLDVYRKVFGPNGERAPYIKSVMARVLDDYLRETGARRVVGFELRRYLRNRPNSQQEAYQLLEELDALHRHHRSLGLAPAEYRHIQRRWLAEITPEGISVEELAEVIHPSRYVRGSDVLDLFGR